MALTVEDLMFAWANQVVRAERAEAQVAELQRQLDTLNTLSSSKVKDGAEKPKRPGDE